MRCKRGVQTEMTQPIDLPGAVEYNKNAEGKHWEFESIPQSLRRARAYGYDEGFCYAVAAFQEGSGIDPVDGKLGPVTAAKVYG